MSYSDDPNSNEWTPEEPNAVWSPEEQDREPRDNPILTSLAWILIVAAVTLIVVVRQFAPQQKAPEGDLERGELVMSELMGRYIIGVKEFLRITGEEIKDVETLLDKFPAKTVPEHLCLAILKGEVNGPRAALDHLDGTFPVRDDEVRLHGILRALYEDYLEEDRRASTVPQDDRDFLCEKLGWFGELALSPPPPQVDQDRLAAGVGGPAALRLRADANEADRDEPLRLALQTLVALGSGAIGVCFLGLIGGVGLILLVIFASKGKLQKGLGAPIRYSGIYAETFALWLLAFPGLSILYPLLMPGLDILESGGLGMITSLVVLLWPLLRGIGWQRLCEDIGWTSGTRPGLEPLLGIVCYTFAIPLLGIGLLFYALFVGLQGAMGSLLAQEAPSHPIVEYLVRDDPWTRFKLIFLACVVAPIVEEAMFRGVLYRHLRELTRDFGGGWSFALSALLVSFIFAVIHPQGLLFVPMLMGVAMGLTIGREWRGTLLPSIGTHAIHNGILLAVFMQALGS